MRTIRTAVAVMALAGACALGTACGDDYGGGSAATTIAGGAATTSAGVPTTAAGAATSTAGGAATPAGGQRAGAATITISGFAFPESTTVAAGSTIKITNDDSDEHSFTADDGSSFDTDIEGGESADVTAPMAPGTYTFHCKYHSSMKATLIVE
jgi:plastocyanin